MSKSKKTTKIANAKSDRDTTTLAEFFPKRGSTSKRKVSIPMIAEAGAKQKAAKDATKVSLKAAAPASTKNGKRGMTGLDAAAAVLAEARKPMSTQQMVEAMTKRGLWKTNGKTPAATLNAALHRDLKAKGKKSRFFKAGRGKFTVASNVRKGA